MDQDQETTVAVFRKWRDDGRIIALFPCELGNVGQPGTCQSFEHFGQHGAANLSLVIERTVPATPGEYAALKRELESPPYEYHLEVRQRTPADAYQARARQCGRGGS